MKKIILIIIALSFVSTVFAGGITGAHKKVIARQTVAGGGSSCTSNTKAIGDDDEDVTDFNVVALDVVCVQYTASCSGDIDELRAFVEFQASDEYQQMGIYSNNATPDPDEPDNLLKDSGGGVGGNNDGGGEWITHSLDSVLSITESTLYWICIQSKTGIGTVRLRYGAQSGPLLCEDNGTSWSEGAMPASITCDVADTYDLNMVGWAQ